MHIDKFEIARPEQVLKRIDDLKHRSSDIKSRLAKPLKNLWDPSRDLASIDNLNVFQELYEKFPNFSDVIEFYEINALALNKLKQPFEAIPVLLQGDPGLGKTYFASELARLLNLDFYEISMATTTASFAISGSNLQWGEGSTGFIANSLTSSKFANPMFLIDEIDKAPSSSQFNAISAFYSLLETHSAKRFKDEALEIELDTSKVIWIATSNYLNQIPQPIQSRMRIFNIEKANIDEMPSLIKSIYQNIRNSKFYSGLISETISDELINHFIEQTPRQIKLSIESGLMKAITNNRSNLVLSDLPDIKSNGGKRYGFL